ncbi:MAG: hypothetical protein A2992_02250 [Elusimicrobia bacterium RIFCSPLOWO2_01_FULL_59_12]|nr:MAG: hypothetical protein A2992_02250 [Elusimicrobia bacterium RIFCSPLOWO2_01_FULL_59_12]
MSSMTVKKSRTKRFNLRATAQQEKLIRSVARQNGVSVTDFILKSAYERAEQVLADRREFVLSASRWKAFLEALDRPVQPKPRLARLLAEPSLFERPA